jgi:hypothetical protein
MKHELKIWPQYYCRVEDGSKTFEVRKNDRGFQPGDEVILQEYNPEKEGFWQDNDPMGPETWEEKIIGFTGKSLKFKIGYVLPIEEGKVVFSLLKAENE